MSEKEIRSLLRKICDGLGGVAPPYMGPDVGPQPDYLAPDVGPVPLYLGTPPPDKP
jgi:hypothetical protein